MNAERKSELKPGTNFFKDFSWYLLSSVFPLLVGFIKTPIFTRHFSTEDFGNLGIVQVTFSYLGMLLFSWIASILWRFYQRFRLDKRLDHLFGNLLIFFLISLVFLLFGTLAWYFFESKSLLQELILVSFGHLVFSQLVMGYLVAVRLESKASLYTIFQSVRAVLSFLLSLYLVFVLEENIVALITGLLVVDAISLLILVVWNPVGIRIRFGSSWQDSRELFSYGMAGLVLNLSIMSINLSDRYVILASENLSSVGIYDQVYKISQLSVIALVTVFFNTINPTLFKQLEKNLNSSLKSMSRYLLMFLVLGLPLIVYMSLFSEELSKVLLGSDFRGAHTIMPYVFFAAFFQGISNFWELRMKFSKRMRLLSSTFLFGAVFNLFVNLWFVPRYGFQWAAISTLLTYVLLVLFLSVYDRMLLRSLSGFKDKLGLLLGILALQVILFVLVDKFDPSMPGRIGVGLIFVFFYIWILKRSRIPLLNKTTK